eukprot:194542_1
MHTIKRLLSNYSITTSVLSSSFISNENNTSNTQSILPAVEISNNANYNFDRLTLLNQATRIIGNARTVVVITGAGISADSGIPTYRSLTSSSEGIWNKAGVFKTAFYGSWIGWLLSNNNAWKLYYKHYYQYSMNAKPNNGHKALLDLYNLKEQNNMTIITQNVDRLHHKSGLPNDCIIEMHGNACTFKCNLCGSNAMNDLVNPMLINEDFISPNCPRCRIGKARPAVVFFGERLKYSNILRVLDIFNNLNENDVVIVIGTSLQVKPVAELPEIAIYNEIPIIEINLEEYIEGDNKHNIFLQGNASVILPNIITLLCALGFKKDAS